MGTDIHGFVECRTWRPGRAVGEVEWCAAIDLSLLGLNREYEVFDCLFGVRASGHWRPVAADRGLPSDASTTTRAELADRCDVAFGSTWLDWPEVTAIDWDEPALPRATHIARYRQLPDQSRKLVHRSVWPRGFARAQSLSNCGSRRSM
ncbi:hypothetical protein [Embleya sp. NBC_00896]|uniref:hypothetical protein n=1 Tax=Embleya sp. NBC_00896 TaxID=2975961 RepID=UPI00386D8C83|nr:hypothetical protein OG928_26050 [Embleya sp. NBC_00896]